MEKNETEALHKAAGETVQAAVKAGITRKKIQEGMKHKYRLSLCVGRSSTQAGSVVPLPV